MQLSQKQVAHYRPEIDGLRCIAVVPVLLYHAGLGPFTGGYVGVDVFFVISGYLITSILLNDLGKDKFSFATFYERRTRRIFPALFFVTATTFAAAWSILSPGEMKDFSQSVAATMAFVSNFLFYLKSGYFTPDVDTFPLIHIWSLAVEEQFYIVFPAVLLILYRFRRLPIAPVLATILVLSLVLSIAMQDRNPTANFFLPFSRAWELMAGALIAVNDRSWRGWLHQRRAIAFTLEAAGLVMILAVIVLYDRGTPFPGWYGIPPVLGTALIIAATTPQTPVGRILSTGPFVGIGLLSYSLYLWHQPIFALARSVHGVALGRGAYVVMIAVSFAIAYLSWRYVEKPFRSRAFLTRRTLFLLAGSLSLLLAALGAAGHLTGGFPSRYPPEILRVARTMELSPKRDECHTDGRSYRRPAEGCRYLARNVTWAALGDSHVIELAYGLAERLRPRGEGLLHLSFSSCPPALGFDSRSPGCSAWLNDAVTRLERNRQIGNVLLVFRHSLYLYGDQRETYPRLPEARPLFLRHLPADEARAAYWRNFRTLVARLLAASKRVYIVEPVPELPAAADYFVFKAGGDPNNRPGAPRAYYLRRQGPILAEIRRLASVPGVTILQPSLALCGGERCAAVFQGQALYFDDNHLSLPGARRVLALEAQRGRLP